MSPTARPAPIRVVLVDDEPHARRQMRERLSAHPAIVIVGEADRVKVAAELVQRAKPEVIFLDVQMPGGTGFDLLPLLGDLDPSPAVVFVTAYDQYALRAFEANALDYLTKPVSARRLAITINRLRQPSPPSDPTSGGEAGAGAAARPLELRDLVLLREKNSMRMVEASEICAVEAEADYTRIRVAGGHTVLMRKTMSQWEQELPALTFHKISRRLLLNMRRIQGLVVQDRENAAIHCAGRQEPLLVSRVELRRIRQWLELAGEEGDEFSPRKAASDRP